MCINRNLTPNEKNIWGDAVLPDTLSKTLYQPIYNQSSKWNVHVNYCRPTPQLFDFHLILRAILLIAPVVFHRISSVFAGFQTAITVSSTFQDFNFDPRPLFATQLMRQPWYQKTAQTLVNTLLSFLWHNRLL